MIWSAKKAEIALLAAIEVIFEPNIQTILMFSQINQQSCYKIN